MQDAIVQTRLSRELATQIQAAAAAEGLTAAAWLRRLVLREFGVLVPVVAAHAEPRTHCDPRIILPRALAPHHFLRPLRELSATDRVFALLDGETRAPVRPSALYSLPWFKHPSDHRFVLEGSFAPWLVVSTMHVETTGIVELTLRIDTNFDKG